MADLSFDQQMKIEEIRARSSKRIAWIGVIPSAVTILGVVAAGLLALSQPYWVWRTERAKLASSLGPEIEADLADACWLASCAASRLGATGREKGNVGQKPWNYPPKDGYEQAYPMTNAIAANEYLVGNRVDKNVVQSWRAIVKDCRQLNALGENARLTEEQLDVGATKLVDALAAMALVVKESGSLKQEKILPQVADLANHLHSMLPQTNSPEPHTAPKSGSGK